MQDNKNKHAFDNDILQCKADILKALGTSGEQMAQTPPAQPPQLNSENQEELSLDDLALEIDLSDTDPAQTSKIEIPLEPASDSVPPVRILPFELLSKRPSLPAVTDSDTNQQISSLEPEAQIIPEQKSEPLSEFSDEVNKEEKQGNADEFSISDDDLLDISNIDSEELVHENEVLKKTLEQLEKLDQEAQAQKQQLTSQLKELSETIEPLRRTNQQLELRLDELTKQFDAAERESNQVQQGLLKSIHQEKASHADMKNQLQLIEAELQKTRKARDFLSESFSSVTEQNQQLQSQLEELKHEKAGGSELARQQSQEILTLHKQLNEQAGMLKRQTEQIQSQEKELQPLYSQNNLLREELSKTETILSQDQALIRQLEAQIRGLKEETSSAEQQVKDLQEFGKQFQSKEESLREETQTVQTLYAKYREQTETEISEQAHRIGTLLGQINLLELKCGQLKNEAELNSSSLKESIAAKEKMQNELEQQLGKHSVLQSDFSDLENKLANQDADFKSAMEALSAENNRLISEQQDIKSELEQSRQEIAELRAEIASPKETNDRSKMPSALDDKTLEVTLNPEELTALMEFNSSDDTQTEPAEPVIVSDMEPVSCDKTADTDMPAFSLADLIMSEHRRSASSRRHKIEPAAHIEQAGVRHVVEQYIKPAAQVHEISKTGSARMWDDDFLTPFQRELLHEMIEKDIRRLDRKAFDRNR